MRGGCIRWVVGTKRHVMEIKRRVRIFPFTIKTCKVYFTHRQIGVGIGVSGKLSGRLEMNRVGRRWWWICAQFQNDRAVTVRKRDYTRSGVKSNAMPFTPGHAENDIERGNSTERIGISAR